MSFKQFLLESSVTNFIEQYVKLHNEAAKEYKQVFAKIGTKMWRDDHAHSVKHDNVLEVVESLGLTLDDVKKTYQIERPLTVLDSYPHVTKDQKSWLNAEVDKIYKKYTELLKRA